MSFEPEWRVVGQSVRGAAHLRSGLPNQDAVRWLPASGVGPALILAVSDGHGSVKSFRSNIGSELAVDATAWLIQDLLDGQPDPTNLSAVKRTAEERLPREIARRWREAVDAHLLKTPLAPDELDSLQKREGASARRLVETNPYLAYGATVLAVLVTSGFVLYLQLGDGDILVVSDEGEVSRPLPGDARLFANETTSLCMREAWREIRFRFQANYGRFPALILVSSDGYANSFVNDEAFLRVGKDLFEMFRAEGAEFVAAHLEEWLSEASSSGSGDDVTLGVLYRGDVAGSQSASAAPISSEVEQSSAESAAAESKTGATLVTDCVSPSEAEDVAPPPARPNLRTAQMKQEAPREPAKRLPELFVDK